MELKYSKSFYDAQAKHLSERIENINNFIKNNPTSDPNAREMCELVFDVTGLAGQMHDNDGYELAGEIVSKYDLYGKTDDIINKRCEQFSDKENNPLYKFFQGTGEINNYPLMRNTYDRIGTTYTKEIFSRCCGILNYCQQRERDITSSDEKVYDNANELNELSTLINNHPEAILSKRFKENLDDMFSEIKMAYNKTPKEFKDSRKKYYELKERIQYNDALLKAGKRTSEEHRMNVESIQYYIKKLTTPNTNIEKEYYK